VKYAKRDLLDMYYHLVNGRIFTEKMHQAVNDGHIRTSYHTALGEEAYQVAALSALRPDDWVVMSHRSQPAALMRLDLYRYTTEIFGKKDGMHNGCGFDLHISDMKGPGHVGVRMATLGSNAPMYVGFAWALKQKGKRQVALLFMGDGAMSEGACYEAMNIGSLYNVPLIYVIDNNGWAMTTPLNRQSVNPNVSDRAKPFHIPTFIVDGSDLMALRRILDQAVEIARENRMVLVEVKNKRWGAHYYGQTNAYRDDMDLIADAMENQDCVKIYERYLLEHGICDEAHFVRIKEERAKAIDEAVRRAAEARLPTEEEIYHLRNIYTMPETGGEL
jgi:pyruvate dehydrogenase E1 component alpha subunit